MILYSPILGPGESLLNPLTWTIPVPEFLGDSLRDGEYHFTASVELNSDTIHLGAGSANLRAKQAPLPRSRLRGGLTFQAETRAVAGSPQSYETTLTVSNPSTLPIEIAFSGVPVVLEAYRNPHRTRKPAWRKTRRPYTESPANQIVFAPGESRTFRMSFSAPEVLGDSLRAGKYYLLAASMRGSWAPVLLDAGSVRLTR
jgi:hypothetical protein